MSKRLSCERIPQTTKPGTEKGYYVYIEDDGNVYIETKDDKGETVLVLDMETNQQLVPDLITEKDTDKCFIQPGEQEDQDETETISSTSISDNDREEVKTSLHAIADAFHKIGNEYKHLCSIVLQMSKVQAANVIGKLPVIPFVGRRPLLKKSLRLRSKWNQKNLNLWQQ